MTAMAAVRFGAILSDLEAQAAKALEAVGEAMEYFTQVTDDDGTTDLGPGVAAVSRIQTIIGTLRDLEATATRPLGQAVYGGTSRDGTLPDGRPWVLRRTASRKQWDHDEWKRDARAKVVDAVWHEEALDELTAYAVDDATGEVQDADLKAILFQVVERSQEVHGSTSPRVGQLKALGLDPDNYCETVRGSWKVDTLEAATPDDTTTTED